MKNCLITTLKGIVNNDALEKLGEMVVNSKHWNTDTNAIYYRKNGATGSVRAIKGNIYVSNSDSKPVSPISAPYTASGTLYIWVDDNDSEFAISNYDEIINMQRNAYITPIKLNALTLGNSLINLDYGNVSSVNDSCWASIKRVGFYKSVGFDISVYTIISKLVIADTINTQKNNVVLTMSALGEVCQSTIDTFELNGNTVSGSVEEFVAKQRLAGVTTKASLTLNFGYVVPVVTFNGSPLIGGRNNSVSWTSSPNTITCNGTTISA